MKILVTGATGLVGNNCLRQLLAGSHEVLALVRQGHDTRPFEGLDVELHMGDLLQPGSLSTAIPDVDAIIHSAGDTHIGRSERPRQRIVNVSATIEIAKVAQARGIRMVFVSSVDALPAGAPDRMVDEETIGHAKCPIGYVLTKREAESDLLARLDDGLDCVIVNPGFMLGPWDWKPSSGRMLLEVATKFTPFGPSGGFSVCGVQEVAAAICRTATEQTASRRYILAGHNVTYVDAWRVFANVSGSKPPIAAAGSSVLKAAGIIGDLRAKITGREGDVNSGAIAMSQLFHYYDSSRAARELGYKILPLEKSAGDAWSWFREYGYVR